MEKDLNKLKIAAIQAQELINMRAKKSKLIAFAFAFDNYRKKIKENVITEIKTFFKPHRVSADKLNVLLDISGGIGDVAISRILVKKLKEALPDADIYFCYDHKEVFDTVFMDGKYVKGFVAKRYKKSCFDLVIAGCHTLTFKYYNKARIAQLSPSFIPIFDKALEMQSIIDVFTLNSPFLDGYGARAIVNYGSSRVANMGLCTGLDIDRNEKALIDLPQDYSSSVLKRFGLNTPYITVHNGVNTNTAVGGGYLTRAWPLSLWTDFAAMFKKAFPDIKIVHIGTKDAQKFDFSDISLLGKTSIQETLYILKNSALHIDGDSGMVHLSNLLDTKCLVLYGPSEADYLSYAHNINISAPFCGGCMNVVPDWAVRCSLSYPQAKSCMSSIKAGDVFLKAKEFLDGKKYN